MNITIIRTKRITNIVILSSLSSRSAAVYLRHHHYHQCHRCLHHHYLSYLWVDEGDWHFIIPVVETFLSNAQLDGRKDRLIRPKKEARIYLWIALPRTREDLELSTIQSLASTRLWTYLYRIQCFTQWSLDTVSLHGRRTNFLFGFFPWYSG